MTTHSKGNSITKTVSMDVDMGSNADERARRLGFRSFSAYVQHLIRSDLIDGGNLTLRVTPVSAEQQAANDKAAANVIAKSYMKKPEAPGAK